VKRWAAPISDTLSGAVGVAEQMAAYLKTGAVMNAINIPSVSAEDAAKLNPYLKLGEQLGAFAGQLVESGIKSVNLEYEGAVSKYNTKPITSVILKGLLAVVVDSVNMVNAPIIAKEREINVSETKHARESDYNTLIRVTVKTDKEELYVAGTIFAAESRIVEVGSVKLEATIGHHMLYINNEDKPGLIGNLGKLLGDAKVNIANFHLGRGKTKTDAIALLEVDTPLSEDLLEKVNKLPSVLRAKLLQF
jgi:D-3-phosphoglycerate dehydrogenase